MKKMFIPIAVLLGAGTIVSSAVAYNWKILPGSACIPSFSSNGSVPPFATNPFGQLWPTGPGTSNFNCPILRDSAQGTTGVAQMTVTVYDDNAGEVICTMTAVDQGGGLITSNTKGSGGPFAGGYKALQVAVASSADWGAYNLTCIVAQNIKITQVQWVEFDGA